VTIVELNPEPGATLDGAKAWLRHHLEMRRHPMNLVDVPAAVRTIATMRGVDPVSWSASWLETASDFAHTADAAEQQGDIQAARDAWWQAYQFAFLGRYPVANHPAKRVAYARAREYFLRAVSLNDPPVERVEVPFHGKDGEGSSVVFYVARPKDVVNPPVVITWGGIDSWKEESLIGSELYWERGIATIHVDMPGVGESPVLAGIDSERLWDPVFEWIAGSDLDANHVGVLGASFGGYWAHKLAHTHREKLAAAVNWAGGVHLTFQRSWQETSRHASSYLMDLMAARAGVFGGSTFEDFVARSPELSLLDQGILEGHSCPLLIVNGKNDMQNTSDDAILAIEYGDPKTLRLYPGGHMGADMKNIRIVIADWMQAILRPVEEGNKP